MPERAYSRTAYRAMLAAYDNERDFADWLTGIVAALTVRVGGIDELIAGRPGSWESGQIAEWMRSAGCNESSLADGHAYRARDLEHRPANGGGDR